jgi:UDPglucose 6-dehydrogenase
VKITVIGVGHVGLVTAACMADLGHDVVGMDDDRTKVETLQAGEMPFYEQGLAELTADGVAAGRLRFTDDAADAIAGADVVFISVGTPTNADGSPNLSYVQAAAASVASHATGPVVVAEKSTVPVRTGERIRHALTLQARAIGSSIHHDVVSNPEFLREGTAVEDTLRPDRIVVGADSERAQAIMREVYAPLLARHECPYVATDVRTAELIKHSSNAFLATKISFINAVARICELAGADVQTVADAMGHDQRIGRAFLNAGLGYGGSCLVGEETVLVRRDGATQHLSMAEWWRRVTAEGLDGWEVLAWDPDRESSVFLPVAALTARPYIGELTEIRTKMGRRIRCTVDHPFVVGNASSGAEGVRLAGDLTEEDWLPLACATADVESTVSDGEVLAAVGAGAVRAEQFIHRVSVDNLSALRRHARSLPAPRRYDVVRNGTVRLDELDGMGVRFAGGSYGTARNGTYVPNRLPMDEDFWRMIGLFLAEGYVTRDGSRMRICWTFHPTDEQPLVDFVVTYWERLGVKVSVNRRPTAMAVSISSRLLGTWFEEVLQTGSDCYDKRVPDAIWAAPDAHKRALLRGLWDGDGSWSLVQGGPSVVLEYGTVSSRLADAMLRLLGMLGIVASQRIGRTAKSTVDTHWLRISGADQVEDALWLFPDDEAEEIRRAISAQRKRIAPTGYRRRGDAAWVRVAEVRRERFDGLVYSMEVPGAHTVVTTGGLVTHNCFPKDVKAFIHIAAELGYDFGMLRETERVNREAKAWPLQQLRRLVWNIADKEVAILGVAFKPGTDDIRDAPALEVIDALLDEGASVRLHDPVALDHVRDRYPEATFCDKAEDAVRGAHAVVVCTEWDEYRALRPERLHELLAYPIVVDARNVWDPAALAAADLTFASVGTAPAAVPGA